MGIACLLKKVTNSVFKKSKKSSKTLQPPTLNQQQTVEFNKQTLAYTLPEQDYYLNRFDSPRELDFEWSPDHASPNFNSSPCELNLPKVQHWLPYQHMQGATTLVESKESLVSFSSSQNLATSTHNSKDNDYSFLCKDYSNFKSMDNSSFSSTNQTLLQPKFSKRFHYADSKIYTPRQIPFPQMKLDPSKHEILSTETLVPYSPEYISKLSNKYNSKSSKNLNESCHSNFSNKTDLANFFTPDNIFSYIFNSEKTSSFKVITYAPLKPPFIDVEIYDTDSYNFNFP